MNEAVIVAIFIACVITVATVSIASGSFGLAERTNPYSTPECGGDVGRIIGSANGTSHFGGYECSTKPCIWNLDNPWGRCFA